MPFSMNNVSSLNEERGDPDWFTVEGRALSMMGNKVSQYHRILELSDPDVEGLYELERLRKKNRTIRKEEYYLREKLSSSLAAKRY